MFTINQEYLIEARSILFNRQDIYWIIGGACTGKSTISQAISATHNIDIYDLDQHIYDRFMGRYTWKRHPANKTWFSAPNPLAWALSLSEAEFDAFNRAANAEYLDLLSVDLEKRGDRRPLIMDGGFTHPSILVQVVRPETIFCLDMSDDDRVRIWETSETRSEMRDWIRAMSNPERMWRKFLSFDQLINRTLVKESRQNGIEIFFRDETISSNAIADIVAGHFGLISLANLEKIDG